jgi:8-oxo-dGTP pyrophosphatase MutT (NUDIX family)
VKILNPGEQVKAVPDKARVIVIDELNQEVPIVDYDGCLMYPGGKIDDGETPVMAGRRELSEELGITIPEPKKLFTFQLMAENYPERDGTITPQRLLETDYFLAKMPEIKLGQRNLTEKEKLGKVAIKLVKINQLLEHIESHKTENERWPYFKSEITIVTRRLLELMVRLGG